MKRIITENGHIEVPDNYNEENDDKRFPSGRPLLPNIVEDGDEFNYPPPAEENKKQGSGGPLLPAGIELEDEENK